MKRSIKYIFLFMKDLALNIDRNDVFFEEDCNIGFCKRSTIFSRFSMFEFVPRNFIVSEYSEDVVIDG